MPTFTSLVEDMLVQAKQLDIQMAQSGKQPPNFDDDTMVDLSPEMVQIKDKLVDAAQVTKRLAQGARGSYTEMLFTFADEVALRAIYKYNLATCVPLKGTASFAEISISSNLREDLVERFLRQAMSNQIFTESSPGQVAHTARSRILVEDSDAYDALGLLMFDLSDSASRIFDALDKWGPSGEPTETGWCLQNNASVGLYQDLASQPERARRFGAGMRYFGKGPGYHISYLTNSFDWQGLDDREGAVFVDIGGGHGTVSRALAESTKNVKFVVQDLPGTCEAGRNVLPAGLKDRVSFSPHDFFQDQPIRDADVYFFRWIMHNWSDGYCVKILKALVPALKPGARVVNFEFVLKDGPEERWSKKMHRDLDMLMQSQFNAPERTERAWRELFQKVDTRLQLKSIITPEGSLMSIIEAVWDA